MRWTISKIAEELTVTALFILSIIVYSVALRGYFSQFVDCKCPQIAQTAIDRAIKQVCHLYILLSTLIT